MTQELGDVASAHTRGIAQLALREGCFCLSENLFEALPGGRLGVLGFSGLLVYQLEREGRGVGFEGELQAIGAGCGAMLDAQLQVLAIAT